MTILQSIAVIGGSVGGTVLMGFVFKWINAAKTKSLKKTIESLVDQNTALENRNKGLQNKVDQMIRERQAGSAHLHRIGRTEEETKVLKKKIDKAHTEEEILDLISYIDNDNNEVLKK